MTTIDIPSLAAVLNRFLPDDHKIRLYEEADQTAYEVQIVNSFKYLSNEDIVRIPEPYGNQCEMLCYKYYQHEN